MLEDCGKNNLDKTKENEVFRIIGESRTFIYVIRARRWKIIRRALKHPEELGNIRRYDKRKENCRTISDHLYSWDKLNVLQESKPKRSLKKRRAIGENGKLKL